MIKFMSYSKSCGLKVQEEKGRKMSTNFVYLDDVPSVMKKSEVPSHVVVRNEKRIGLKIGEKSTGIYSTQVFTSDCLPDEIPYKFLGYTRIARMKYYATYVAEVVTAEKLSLEGRYGYEKGIDILNSIVQWFTWNDQMLIARSIVYGDLKNLNLNDQNEKSLSYWVASPATYGEGVYSRFGPGSITNGIYCAQGNGQYLTRGDYYITQKEMPIRPVMTLRSSIILGK